jgi:dTDP-4-dehydrorhamnose 3,5-epimerase
MRFYKLPLQGAFLVEPELREDERGAFARTWCQREFAVQDLDTRLVQCSMSYSRRKGTLRGMHYQAAPHVEAKLVRCTRGAIYAVVADMRPQSPSYKLWCHMELTADNRHAVFVPASCAFGFMTLADDSEVFYQMSEFFYPELARGFRYDDPAFGITWPEAPAAISPRDLAQPRFVETPRG